MGSGVGQEEDDDTLALGPNTTGGGIYVQCSPFVIPSHVKPDCIAALHSIRISLGCILGLNI